MSATGRLVHDEREWSKVLQHRYDLDALHVSSILRHLDRAAASAGTPLDRTIEPRWNAEGDPIGPDMRMSNEAAIALETACAAVRRALDNCVQDLVGSER